MVANLSYNPLISPRSWANLTRSVCNTKWLTSYELGESNTQVGRQKLAGHTLQEVLPCNKTSDRMGVFLQETPFRLVLRGNQKQNHQIRIIFSFFLGGFPKKHTPKWMLNPCQAAVGRSKDTTPTPPKKKPFALQKSNTYYPVVIGSREKNQQGKTY